MYLIANGKEQIHFEDISKIRVTLSQHDLQSLLNTGTPLAEGSTVCFENVEVSPHYGSETNVDSCAIDAKGVVINAGTTNEKKLSLKVRLNVESENGEIPLLPSTRRYIRRSQKQ